MHLPIKEDVSKILKGFFQGNLLADESLTNKDNLLQIFSKSYEIWGTFRFKRDEATVTIEVQPSLRIEGAIYLDYNFNRNLKDNTASELVDVLTRNFTTDLEVARKTQYLITWEENGL